MHGVGVGRDTQQVLSLHLPVVTWTLAGATASVEATTPRPAVPDIRGVIRPRVSFFWLER